MQEFAAVLSENIIIGALLNDINLILDAKDIKGDYFTSKVNRILFLTIRKLYKDGATEMDVVDLYAFLDTNSRYKEIVESEGGVEFIETLQGMGEGYTFQNLKPHIENVCRCAFRNDLRDVLIGINDYVDTDSNDSIKKIYEEIEGRLLHLKGNYSTGHKMERVSERLSKVLKNIDKNANKEFCGFPTGFPLVDKYFTYEKGELVVISAPAKFGKSQYVVDQVYRLCIKQNVPMAVIDSELSDTFFVQRLIAKIMNVNFNFIKKGLYKDHKWSIDAYNKAIDILDKSPLYHQYVSGWTQEEIYSEIKRISIQDNIQIIVWDYLKIEDLGDNKKENVELAKMTNFLKNKIAGELELSVVAMAQTSDYSKQEGGLRIWGSNQIKQYASTIVYLVKKNKDQIENDLGEEIGGNMYMFVKENRNGVSMTDESKGINLLFDKSKANFEESVQQDPEIEELVKSNDDGYQQDAKR